MTKASDNLFPGIIIRESANDGSDFSNPSADYRRLFLGEDGLLHVKDSAGAVTDPYTGGGGGYDEGTSFPGSPSTDDKYYRTDRHKLYDYDGTRWLTVHEYTQSLAVLDALEPLAATGVLLFGAISLLENGIYVTGLDVSTFSSGTNDGTNNWTYQLARRTGTSTDTNVGSSFSTSADTANAWSAHSPTMGVAVTANELWVLKVTKVNSPSTAYAAANVRFRGIG